MGKKCAFSYCSNQQSKKGKTKRHIQFHSFPLNRPHMTIKWLDAMRENDWAPTTSSRLCSDHFSDDCYKSTSGPRKLLLPSAVPTIFNFSGTSYTRKLSSHKTIRSRRKKSQLLTKQKNNTPEERPLEKMLIPQNEMEEHSVAMELNNCELDTNPCDNETVIQEMLIIDANDKGDLDFQIEYIDHSDAKDVDHLEYDLELIKNGVCDGSPDPCEPEETGITEDPLTEIRDLKLRNSLKAFESLKRVNVSQQKLLRRKVKILQLRIKRRDKRIQQLRSMVSELKAKVQGFAKGEDLTTGLEGFPHELLSHAIRSRDAKRNAIRYSPQMKEFALTLYSYSSKAYEYVRSLLIYLPNPSLIKKWISTLNKPRIIESQPVTQLIDNIEIISDIREELIIGSISDLIEIDTTHVDDDSLP